MLAADCQIKEEINLHNIQEAILKLRESSKPLIAWRCSLPQYGYTIDRHGNLIARTRDSIRDGWDNDTIRASLDVEDVTTSDWVVEPVCK